MNRNIKHKKPPVITGKDMRAEERASGDKNKKFTDAPDGISGNWK